MCHSCKIILNLPYRLIHFDGCWWICELGICGMEGIAVLQPPMSLVMRSPAFRHAQKMRSTLRPPSSNLRPRFHFLTGFIWSFIMTRLECVDPLIQQRRGDKPSSHLFSRTILSNVARWFRCKENYRNVCLARDPVQRITFSLSLFISITQHPI